MWTQQLYCVAISTKLFLKVRPFKQLIRSAVNPLVSYVIYFILILESEFISSVCSISRFLKIGPPGTYTAYCTQSTWPTLIRDPVHSEDCACRCLTWSVSKTNILSKESNYHMTMQSENEMNCCVKYLHSIYFQSSIQCTSNTWRLEFSISYTYSISRFAGELYMWS